MLRTLLLPLLSLAASPAAAALGFWLLLTSVSDLGAAQLPALAVALPNLAALVLALAWRCCRKNSPRAVHACYGKDLGGLAVLGALGAAASLGALTLLPVEVYVLVAELDTALLCLERSLREGRPSAAAISATLVSAAGPLLAAYSCPAKWANHGPKNTGLILALAGCVLRAAHAKLSRAAVLRRSSRERVGVSTPVSARESHLFCGFDKIHLARLDRLYISGLYDAGAVLALDARSATESALIGEHALSLVAAAGWYFLYGTVTSKTASTTVPAATSLGLCAALGLVLVLHPSINSLFAVHSSAAQYTAHRALSISAVVLASVGLASTSTELSLSAADASGYYLNVFVACALAVAAHAARYAWLFRAYQEQQAAQLVEELRSFGDDVGQDGFMHSGTLEGFDLLVHGRFAELVRKQARAAGDGTTEEEAADGAGTEEEAADGAGQSTAAAAVARRDSVQVQAVIASIIEGERSAVSNIELDPQVRIHLFPDKARA